MRAWNAFLHTLIVRAWCNSHPVLRLKILGVTLAEFLQELIKILLIKQRR